MGIQGLLPLLKDIQTPIHISKYSGKTLGVDAYVWLHRGAYGCAREIVLGDPTPRYIAHALSRIRMLQHFGVKPYLVFDGDKLPAKKHTEDDRESRRSANLELASVLERDGKLQQAREIYSKCVDITPEMAYQLIKVLKMEGIPYVVAPYEADAQLAYLEREGVIEGVVTEDSDLLVFGCKNVLFKLDQAGNAVEMLQDKFWTNRQIALSGWTNVEFRQMAILSGCDYLPSIVGMGLKNAHRLLRRYKTVDKVLQAVRLEGKMRVPPTYSREFRKAELTFVHQRVFDPRTKKLVTLTPLPEGTHDDMLPFIGASMEDEVAMAVAEGTVDPISRTPIVDRVPKPLGIRSSSASNVASTSIAGMPGLYRSTTAPTSLGGGGESSFYRNGGASTSATKKKVVSKEAGLQSLKNFFGGPSAKNNTASSSSTIKVGSSQQSKQKEERVPLAPRDTNRQLEAAPAKPTQSKFFASRQPVTPTPKSPKRSQDCAYLHLGGQLTPPKTRQDPNDSGYWDDECHDMHDFVKSSSPPHATPAPVMESQPIVMDTQELWQDESESQAAAVVAAETTVATQVVQSSMASSVVVPQTPTKLNGRKRMLSASTDVMSSPESGFISSPASSSVRGERVVEETGLEGGDESDTVSSSPLLASRSAEAMDPVTPAPLRCSARKPVLHTSASMSKLEAFRYNGSTTTTPATVSRPTKMLKRSPTLLLGEAGGDDEEERREGDAAGTGRGLFERFRFDDSTPAVKASSSAWSRQLPF